MVRVCVFYTLIAGKYDLTVLCLCLYVHQLLVNFPSNKLMKTLCKNYIICSFLQPDMFLITGRCREMEGVLVKHQNSYYKLSITKLILVNNRYLHLVGNFKGSLLVIKLDDFFFFFVPECPISLVPVRLVCCI